MRARPAVTKGGGYGTAWLRAVAVARAQCSGAAEEWLCRLGRALLLEAGLGIGRGSCRQWLVRTGAAVAVATATSGYGRRRCRRSEKPGLGCGSRAAERALRLFGSGEEGGKFGMKTFGPPLV